MKLFVEPAVRWPPNTNRKRKNNKGPGGPLVRYNWISVQQRRIGGATAKPEPCD